MYLITISLALIVVVVLKFYFEIKLRTFWSNHGIISARFNIGSLVKILCQFKSFTDISRDLYEEHKPKKVKIVGLNFVGSPIAIVISPEVVKLIIEVDSRYFRGRGFYTNANPIATNLFTFGKDVTVQSGLRERFMAAFHAINHNKIHNSMTSYAASNFVTYLEPDAKYHRDIDLTDLLERYTTFLVGHNLMEIRSCAILNPDATLRHIGLLLNTKEHRIKKLLSYLFPNLFDKFGINIIASSVEDYFIKKLRDISMFRSHFFTGTPFFDEIFKATHNLSEAAACCIQILEASITMATTMSYLLFELALNQEIQDELREEVSTVYYRDNFTFQYDSIERMTYMDCVLSETLRKYPTISTLHRVAVHSYQLPDGSIIPKGARVVIPILALHHDKEYFSDPNKFQPNRFANKPLPFTYLPFGDGYHKCIGAKLAIHQMKIAVAHLIRCYRFDVCERTEVPIKFNSYGLWNVPKTDVWLNISKAR